MPSVYAIEGASRSSGKRCKRVRHGGKRGCTIELCRGARGRWKFQKNSVRCGR